MPDRLRVKDKDTGYDRTISESELPHGNYQVLKQDAVDINGDDLPPDFHLDDATPATPAEQKKKEN